MLTPAWKSEKTLALIKELAATFVQRESSGPALITVTDTTLSEDRKRATVYVSVLPEQYEAQALDFMKRKRPELREYIEKNSRIRMVPFIDVALDTGEKNRQKIDELLQQ